MPRGYPPFFGQSTFNKRGLLYIPDPVNSNCPASSNTKIFNIAAKGEVHGGLFVTTYGGDTSLVAFRIDCDGSSSSGMKFADLAGPFTNRYGITTGIINYIGQDAASHILWSVSPGLTFETGFDIMVLNTDPTHALQIASGSIAFYVVG